MGGEWGVAGEGGQHGVGGERGEEGGGDGRAGEGVVGDGEEGLAARLWRSAEEEERKEGRRKKDGPGRHICVFNLCNVD